MKARFKVGVRVWAIAAMASLPGITIASGFQLQEQSASGLGVAYAGMAAGTQDASTAFWNPAGLLDRARGLEISGSSVYVMPHTRYRADNGPASLDGGDGGVSSLIPSIYTRAPVSDRVAVGLVINAPFGLSTDWDSPWQGMYQAIISKSETLNVNPVIGVRLNPFVSFGAGVSYQRLKAKLTNAASPLVPGSEARLDGDDWAWGWNVGVLFDLPTGTRVGGTYRSHTDYTINGTLSFNKPALASLDSNATTSLRLPASASIALSQPLASKVRVLADYTWTEWKSIQALTVIATDGPRQGSVVSNTALNFENSWRAGMGLEYLLRESWLLRTGIAYDRSPVRSTFRTPRLPDADRRWLSAGAHWDATPRLSLDVGSAYLWVQKASSELVVSSPVPTSLFGEYRSHILIVGSQASYRF
jgi:long-chain fatty acid transport protein